MKTKLIHDWRDAWKWLSINAMLAAATLQAVWVEMTPELKAELPPHLVNYLTMLFLVLGVFGRLTTKKDNNAGNEESKS